MGLGPDIFGVLKGLRKVVDAGRPIVRRDLETKWQNSSIRDAVQETRLKVTQSNALTVNPTSIRHRVTETVERLDTVRAGIVGLAQAGLASSREQPRKSSRKHRRHQPLTKQSSRQEDEGSDSDSDTHVYVGDISIPEMDYKKVKDMPPGSVKDMIMRVGKEVEKRQAEAEEKRKAKIRKKAAYQSQMVEAQPRGVPKLQPLAKTAPTALSDESRERRVPASRVGRLWSYGSLAAGLGMGAAAEAARKAVGRGDR